MENTRKCRACGRTFKPDFRNRERQAYCSHRACQLQRRTLAQTQRRQRAGVQSDGSKTANPARGLQEASVLSEADLSAENPVIIGLISMVTGLTNYEDLERVHRQLWMRGRQIISAGAGQSSLNPVIISLLKQAEAQADKTD